MDRISAEKRSKNMQRIRAFGTAPEVVVRHLVCQVGFRSRYRLHNHKLPGRPDVVFPTMRKIIFVHGCFWHSHQRCKLAHTPKSRLGYWKPKLQRNKMRDRRNASELRREGWRVLIVWECQTRNSARQVQQAIAHFLKSR